MERIHRRTVQKDLQDQDNHDDVITNLEPDILEYEVKWALESGFPTFFNLSLNFAIRSS